MHLRTGTPGRQHFRGCVWGGGPRGFTAPLEVCKGGSGHALPRLHPGGWRGSPSQGREEGLNQWAQQADLGSTLSSGPPASRPPLMTFLYLPTSHTCPAPPPAQPPYPPSPSTAHLPHLPSPSTCPPSPPAHPPPPLPQPAQPPYSPSPSTCLPPTPALPLHPPSPSTCPGRSGRGSLQQQKHHTWLQEGCRQVLTKPAII